MSAIHSITQKLDDGHLNFFLGSAASSPLPLDDWEKTGALPSAGQLREWLLAASLTVPDGAFTDEKSIFGERGGSLAEVASFFELRDRQLYRDSLRKAFATTDPKRSRPMNIDRRSVPYLVAESIKRSKRRASESGAHYSFPIVMTTNFDTLIEEALEENHLPYRSFVLSGTQVQKLVASRSSLVGDLNRKDLSTAKALDGLVHVLKLHGEISWSDGDPRRVVMSESDYVRYLLETPVDRLMPFSSLKTAWDNRSCLFLGYSFSDWNMRALLRYLWPTGEKPGVYRWAVSLGFSQYQEIFLKKEFGVVSINSDLTEFASGIRAAWNAIDIAGK